MGYFDATPLFYVLIYMWYLYMCTAGKKRMFLVLFYYSLPWSLGTGPFTQPGSRMAANKPQESSCLCPLWSWVTDVSINARDLNSGPYAYLASTFPAEPFLQLCNIGSFCGDIILDWIPSSCCSEASFFSVTFLLSLWTFHKCVQWHWSYPQLPSSCPDLSKAHAPRSSLLPDLSSS